MAVTEQRYPDAQAAAVALAHLVAADLREGLSQRGAGSLVVPGGRSPVPFFEALRRETLDWSRVTVTLTDERWVDAGSTSSNEHLVRANLLLEHATVARLVGLKTAAATAAAGVPLATHGVDAIARPFDAVVLGMGEDGHTASLFPGLPELATLLDPEAGTAVAATEAPVAPHERITLTAKRLLDARRLYLSISGDAKRKVYESAVDGAPATTLPIGAFLRQVRVPMVVLLS